MAISAALVKELREKTGAGMMDCKKALETCEGDIEKAFDWLREKGIAKAAKKADRIAAEGLTAFVIDGDKAALVEVNSETDFVAKNKEFQDLVALCADLMVKNAPADLDAALKIDVDGKPLEIVIAEASGKIGEKLSFRRFEVLTKELAHEREVLLAQALEENAQAAKPKPENIIEKMVEGRLNKNLKDICLVDQEFIKNPDVTIAQYIGNGKVVEMARFQVGEGIEKKEENFAEEVAKQMGK